MRDAVAFEKRVEFSLRVQRYVPASSNLFKWHVFVHRAIVTGHSVL